MARTAWMRWAAGLAGASVAPSVLAQVPDILSSLDAGTRAMAMGGATTATDVTPHSALLNPAGLGYISSPTLSLSFRNLPETESVLSGNLDGPSSRVDRQYGKTAFTHLGYALPVGRGTVGFSYSIAGYRLDDRSAGFLLVGPLAAVNYRAFVRSQTDLFTLSYGQQNGSSSWGLGVIYANQYINSQESYLLSDGFNQVGSVDSEASGTARGIGVVAGFQGASGANGMWGISLRSPIELTGNDKVTDLYGRIPGRASFGFANRRGIRAASEDYLVYALQADYHFGGERGGSFDRTAALGFGLGLEYNLLRADSRWPIRLGYQRSPKMGDGYASRDAYTFGLGWRPNDGRLGIDINFAKDARGGPVDAAFGLTYRFGN